MKTLATFKVKAGVDMSWVLPLLGEEEKMAGRNYLAGVLREFYLTSEVGVVLDIFEANSVAEAMLDLPLMGPACSKPPTTTCCPSRIGSRSSRRPTEYPSPPHQRVAPASRWLTSPHFSSPVTRFLHE